MAAIVFSGMLRHVASQKLTDVSQVLMRDYRDQYPRRLSSSRLNV
jgi:hypothetical protein